MNPTEKTISYLRTLTFDGYLSSEEVWSLARFLNEHEECRGTWPGNILAPILGDAFEDGALSEPEMNALAEAIGKIEHEWVERVSTGKTGDLTIDSAVIITQPRIPTLAQKKTVEGRSDVQHVVDLNEHRCTCPDWAAREKWPVGHPGRFCKHVPFAIARTGKVLEPWFQALVDDCFLRARGTPPSADWLLIELEPRRHALVSVDKSEWCNVFAPALDGYEHFGFNREQKRWTYGAAPASSGYVEKAVDQYLASQESLSQ